MKTIEIVSTHYYTSLQCRLFWARITTLDPTFTWSRSPWMKRKAARDLYHIMNGPMRIITENEVI